METVTVDADVGAEEIFELVRVLAGEEATKDVNSAARAGEVLDYEEAFKTHYRELVDEAIQDTCQEFRYNLETALGYLEDHNPIQKASRH